MTFSVSPTELAAAKAAGNKIQLDLAYALIKKFADERLEEARAELAAGRLDRDCLYIQPDRRLCGPFASQYNPALAKLATELDAAGFKAKFVFEHDDDNGPYVEIKI